MTDEALQRRLGEEVAVGETRVKAGELLASQEVGYLAMTDEDGPYCLPVSFAYDGEDIYFHGGEGKKSAALEADPRACLVVTGKSEMIKGETACEDNVKAQSVLAYGTVTRLETLLEKDAALRTIIAKYHPECVADPLDPGTLERTTVFRMSLRAVTYKAFKGH